MNRSRNLAGERADFLDHFRFVSVFRDQIDNRATHDHRVRESRNFAGLAWI
jgi:hypothetical protein